MLAVVEPIPAPLATWSRRAALFAVQLVVVAAIMHRFAGLPTPLTLNIFAVAFAIALLAIVIGIAAFVQIWRLGRSGAWSVALGIGIGLLLLAWPAAYAPFFLALPPINDVTTDTAQPPQLNVLAKARPRDANRTAYAGARFAELQATAYPDLKPLLIPRPATETFELVGDIVQRLKWRIAAEEPPAGRGRPGIIEAVDRTLILGFSDDVVIRIDGNDKEARIDVRSQSRYGHHDLGRNAARVRRLYHEITARLESSVSGERAGRRGKDGPRRPREREAVSEVAPKRPSAAAAGRSASPREVEPKAKGRSRDRDK